MTILGGPILGLDRIMDQQAMLERDQAVPDTYGASAARDWQPLATVEAFMWWGQGMSVSRLGQVRPQPEKTVDIDTGGMILPGGTDVTAHDRVARVLDQDGALVEEGPFEILAVAEYEGGLVELSFRKAS